MNPNTFNDVDGRYIGFDREIHTVAPGHTQYANYSDWDTYRGVAALQGMVFPREASDMAQSLVNDAEQSGSYPRWALANTATAEMTGDSVVALIANFYAFGAKDFDVKRALHFMLDAATEGGVGRNGYVERPQIETYLRRGYLPLPTTSCHGSFPAASISLEWSVDDFAISQFASALGDSKTAGEFQDRAQYWQNLFNPTTHSISPRNALGFFPAGPAVVPPGDGCFSQVGFDEGNAEQYVWYVPQNIAGLVTALGGRQAVADRLDKFTSQLNVGPAEPYLWAGNEPNFSGAVAVQLHRAAVEDTGLGRPGAQHAVQPDARRRAGQRRLGRGVGLVCLGGDGLVSQRPGDVDADGEHAAVRSHRNRPSRRQIHSDHRAGCVRTSSPAVHQRVACRWAVDQ